MSSASTGLGEDRMSREDPPGSGAHAVDTEARHVGHLALRAARGDGKVSRPTGYCASRAHQRAQGQNGQLGTRVLGHALQFLSLCDARHLSLGHTQTAVP